MTEAKGWFEIAGVQRGERTLEEQLTGLAPALAAARGKSVCDLGCAEGLIGLEFLRRGAASLYACDYNPALISVAEALPEEPNLARPLFECVNLLQLMQRRRDGKFGRFDIVLALAIVHKLECPEEGLEFMAGITRDLLLIRLPRRSNGFFRAKYNGRKCDVSRILPRFGMRLSSVKRGPREEKVQYWTR